MTKTKLKGRSAEKEDVTDILSVELSHYRKDVTPLYEEKQSKTIKHKSVNYQSNKCLIKKPLVIKWKRRTNTDKHSVVYMRLINTWETKVFFSELIL